MAKGPKELVREWLTDKMAAERGTNVEHSPTPVVPEEVQRQADSSTRLGYLLDDLEEAAAEMRWWSGRTEKYIVGNYRKFEEDHRDFEKLIALAIRAGWLIHPYVRDWIAERRSLGDWEALRTFCAERLERGVRSPMSKADFWLAVEANEPIRQGKGPAAIRRLLIAKLVGGVPEPYFDLNDAEVEKLLARLRKTRQSFHEWLARVVPPTTREDIKADDSSGNRVNFPLHH